MNELPELDRIADKVLAYRPALRVIAGSPDTPLVINEIEIPCYVLEDETRVLSQRGLTGAVGLNPDAGYRIGNLMSSKAISPYVSGDLGPAIESPIRFKNPSGGGVALGYPATLLVDICEAVLKARDSGSLSGVQVTIAQQCDLLVRGLATVGIVALVDEATGYQRIREERALAKILEQFIAERFRPWTRTFPYEFYKEIFRLKGWGSPEGIKRPAVIGHYTNDIVYARIAPGVLNELQQINPKLSSGGRKQRHHQWFTPDIGHPKLKEHLAAVIALMRASSSWSAFRRSLDLAFPKLNTQLSMPMGEDED